MPILYTIPPTDKSIFVHGTTILNRLAVSVLVKCVGCEHRACKRSIHSEPAKSPKSPDLTPCDSFLWGNVKDHFFFFSFPLPLKLRAVHIKKILILNFTKMVPMTKFCGFIVYSKPNNMTLSTFLGKIPETRKIVLYFLSPSPNVVPKLIHIQYLGSPRKYLQPAFCFQSIIKIKGTNK